MKGFKYEKSNETLTDLVIDYSVLGVSLVIGDSGFGDYKISILDPSFTATYLSNSTTASLSF